MLHSLPKNLTPQLYEILFVMGHGDRIAIVDANFPGASHAKRLYCAPELDSTQMLDLILPYFPLDTYVDDAAAYMAVAPGDSYQPTTWNDYNHRIEKWSTSIKPVYLSRNEFYEAAQESYAIIQTGEERLYGNITLRKGVVI